MNQQNFLFFILEKLSVYSRGRCAFASLRYAHPRITRDIREMARLAIFPNFSSATLQKNFVYP